MFKLHKKVRNLASELTDIHDEYKSSAHKMAARIDDLGHHLSAQEKDIQRQTGEIGHLKEELAKYRKIHKPKQLSLDTHQESDGIYVPEIGGPRMLDAIYDCIKHPNVKPAQIAHHYQINVRSLWGKYCSISGRARHVGTRLTPKMTAHQFKHFVKSYRDAILAAIHDVFAGHKIQASAGRNHIAASVVYRAMKRPNLQIKLYNAKHHTNYSAEK